MGVMSAQARLIRSEIEEILSKGSIDCRIHLLWNQLLTNTTASALSYSGLFELKSLSHVELLTDVDRSLQPLLNQPFSWYQGLMKVLSNKYSADKCKTFVSPDNTTHHLLVIHPRFLDGFVNLTLDFPASKGELSIVFRQTDGQKREQERENIHNLIEGVINACYFHLWASLVAP